MNGLIRFKKEHAVLFSAFVALFSLLLMTLGGILSAFFMPFFGENYYALMLVQESFALFFLLLIACACGNARVLTRSGAGLAHAAQVAAYPIIFIGLVAVSMFALGLQSGEPLQSPGNIAIYLAAMLSIGLVEEVAFRGIIAESLIARYGTSYAGIWRATAIGGVIFGAAHISNIFGAEPLGVLVQMAVATVLGMLFSAIYYRTGNLWICILLHAGLDGGSLLNTGIFESSSTIADVVSEFSLANLLPCITYGLPILFLLRRNKNFEVQLWFGSAEPQQEMMAD